MGASSKRSVRTLSRMGRKCPSEVGYANEYPECYSKDLQVKIVDYVGPYLLYFGQTNHRARTSSARWQCCRLVCELKPAYSRTDFQASSGPEKNGGLNHPVGGGAGC